MNEPYLYDSIRIERGGWSSVAEAAADTVASAGGVLFGIWRGEIGWHNDEGVVLSAWPAAAGPGEARLDDVPGILEWSRERVVATVRPTAPDPPELDGVYAHRWFECADRDWAEFLELSESAWPDFERTFDGTRIIGFWRSADASEGEARILLVTRYASLAAWERSRPYAPDPVAGAAEAIRKFRRRAEITRRTIVRIGRRVPI